LLRKHTSQGLMSNITLRLSGSPKLLRIEEPLRRVRSKRVFAGRALSSAYPSRDCNNSLARARSGSL
jgi:hypothetical protein